ncbi:AfsR/SARP family transcriptional regulator [Pseudonocardia adelaidensis]|uniref:Bacterial transcriptional activator domain-containing protein n=1 Tax=Pseudonocardia adelaidensis TaxID=648754 RepID=A0ABP9NHH5_9PSEU
MRCSWCCGTRPTRDATRGQASPVAYGLLMRALAERGDHAAAVVVYDQLRRVLRDDLGVSPSPASQHLLGRLLRRGPHDKVSPTFLSVPGKDDEEPAGIDGRRSHEPGEL